MEAYATLFKKNTSASQSSKNLDISMERKQHAINENEHLHYKISLNTNSNKKKKVKRLKRYKKKIILPELNISFLFQIGMLNLPLEIERVKNYSLKKEKENSHSSR